MNSIRRLAAASVAAVAMIAAAAPGAHATSPPGANDFTCKPTAAHPSPVVLVHGTFEGAADNWATVAPQIKAAGYCVFALDYGNRGTGDIPTSAGQLQRFVDAVLAATGAAKVSIVGHSQVGMMPRWYIKFLGGAAKVDDLVGLAPSNHGTTNPGAFVTGQTFCPACDQQRAGSAFPAAQRGRRDAGRRLLHGRRDEPRRGRHAVHLGVPRARAEYGEHPAPGPLPRRPDRPHPDPQRPGRPALDAAGARPARPGGPVEPAALHLTGAA